MDIKSKNNNIDVVSYTIYTKKLKGNEGIKVLLLADFHDCLKYKNKFFDLVTAVRKSNPHHIIIAGDIIQGNKWKKETKTSPFSRFLYEISSIAPVFISLGNHDLAGISERKKVRHLLEIKKIEKIRDGKIFVLTNDIVEYDKFKVLSYLPESRITSELGIQEHGLAHDMFIKEYIEKGVQLESSDDNFIIEFIIHNPHLIARSENNIGLESLKYVDTFYAGHLHNGYRRFKTIKNNPDKYLDYGYAEKPYSRDKNGKIIWKTFTPLFYSKISLCRGVVYVDNKSQRRILQLRNNHFYINNSNKDNKDLWERIEEEKAYKFINKNSLHALVITGGIRKFFGLSIPHDNPEITEVIYLGEGE